MSRIEDPSSVYSEAYQQRVLIELQQSNSTKAVDAEISKINRIIRVQERFGGNTSDLVEYKGRLSELKPHEPPPETKVQIQAAIDNRLECLEILNNIIRSLRGEIDGLPALTKEYTSKSQVLEGRLDTSSEEKVLLQVKEEMDSINALTEMHDSIIQEAVSAQTIPEVTSIVRKGLNWVSKTSASVFSKIMVTTNAPSLINWAWSRVKGGSKRISSIFKNVEKPKVTHANRLKQFEDLVASISDEELKEEGVFRLAGSSSVVNERMETLEKTGEVKFKDSDSVHDKATTLKRFLRTKIRLQPANGSQEQLQKAFLDRDFDKALSMLDSDQARLLESLFDICKKTALFSRENKMTASNIGVVFGPNLAEMLAIPLADIQSGLECNIVIEELLSQAL